MDKGETAFFCIGIIPLASASGAANHSQTLEEHIFSYGQISKLTFWNMNYLVALHSGWKLAKKVAFKIASEASYVYT